MLFQCDEQKKEKRRNESENGESWVGFDSMLRDSIKILVKAEASFDRRKFMQFFLRSSISLSTFAFQHAFLLMNPIENFIFFFLSLETSLSIDSIPHFFHPIDTFFIWEFIWKFPYFYSFHAVSITNSSFFFSFFVISTEMCGFDVDFAH